MLISRPETALPDSAHTPIVIAGLFRTANGIGEAARGTYRALVAAGCTPIAVDLSEHLASVDLEPNILLQDMPEDINGVLILQLNGPEFVKGLQYLKMTRDRHWYILGYWAWELSVFPKGWESAFPFLSEILTVSEFSANAIRKHSKSPKVSVFGHAVQAPRKIEGDRSKFNIPEDAFVFLTLADSMSSINRKGTFITIEAHKRSFQNDLKKVLVVKTRNLDKNLIARDDLVAAIGGAKNIILLDSALTTLEQWELMASIDSVVSFHRAEGFGLTLAEAMSLGKAVVATNWSGNTDFTNSKNSYLANYSLVSCQDSYGVYKVKDTVWAEVSVEEASRLMTLVFEDKVLREQITTNGLNYTSKFLTPRVLGEKIAAKLNLTLKNADIVD